MTSRSSSHHSSEHTPLLSRQDGASQSTGYTGRANGTISPAVESLNSISDGNKSRRRWPTIIALTVLCLTVVLVCIGFAAPSTAQEYAKQALVFEPDKLSIDSFTSIGVRARIQGVFYLDASRVQSKPVRDLGRAATWIAREVETGESHIQIYLPKYGGALLGSAIIPPIKVNIQNGHYNHLDIVTDVEPGDVDAIRTIAKDFMDGKVKSLDVRAVASVPVSSGLIKLGVRKVTQELLFQGHDVPKVPDFDIQNLRLAEYGLPGHPDGLKAMATVSIQNEYPFNFNLPPLAFQALLPDCFGDYLRLGTAQTKVIHVRPKQPVNASVVGLVQQLPTSLTTACPGSNNSPLDKLVGDYLAGKNTTVYIRGGEQDPDTPRWIGNLLQDITLPFSLPGHPFDNLIKEFALANVHFSLPDPFSEDSRPRISAVVKVLVGLPPEMNVNMDVNKVRADGDVFYHGAKMGKLDLSKWQAANATRVGGDLLIQSIVDDAPLEISDNDVFSKVVQQLVFGDKGVELGVKANVDANTFTALGEFVIRNIPAEGRIFIKPINRGNIEMPIITEMKVVETHSDSLVLEARVNMTNPTDYSAHIPIVNVSTWVNGTRVGYAWTSGDIVPGPNDLLMRASWEVGAIGREWLSQFISGYNTSLTVKTHNNSIPSLPDIGLEMTIPTPHMFGKFLKEATMHLLSSTATFLLVSPFTMFVTSINASALYNGTQIGNIVWDYPFQIEEGENVSPKLPVSWGLDAVGTVKDALGGTLKVDAVADVGVRIGEWRERIWYQGSGIGAKIRL